MFIHHGLLNNCRLRLGFIFVCRPITLKATAVCTPVGAEVTLGGQSTKRGWSRVVLRYHQQREMPTNKYNFTLRGFADIVHYSDDHENLRTVIGIWAWPLPVITRATDSFSVHIFGWLETFRMILPISNGLTMLYCCTPNALMAPENWQVLFHYLIFPITWDMGNVVKAVINQIAIKAVINQFAECSDGIVLLHNIPTVR